VQGRSGLNHRADYFTTNKEVDYSVSGTVNASDGGTLENANITVVEDVTNGNVVAETTTDANGDYSVSLSNGDYRVRANADKYDVETQSITVSDSAITGLDYALSPSEYYEMEFQVDDQTRTGAFENPETLNVEREDGSTGESGFNHNESAYLGGFIQDGVYNFTLVAESNAIYEYKGFVAPGPSADYAEFTPDSIDGIAETTPANESLNESVNVGISELESRLDAIEVTELGREIDCLALEMGLRTLAREPGIRLSINMSARSIGYPRWTQTLKKGLRRDPTVGERLILEITEQSAMQVPELVGRFMADLQSRGITFALDDFGAGYTAFRYLRDFYFDMVKIDGQFIRGVHENPDNQVLTRALVAIAQQFDMFTVAEFVETAQDAAWLAEIGVDCLQGYLFGAPATRAPWRADAPDPADRRWRIG